MKKVDRLGWAVGFSFKSYGVRIGIRSNQQAALERVCAHLPLQWERVSLPIVDRMYSILVGGAGPRANLRRFNLLYGDHVQLVRSITLEDVFDKFASDLRLFVAEFAKHRVFVHAGVVGWKDRAILIPGMSHSGKTTLVDRLIRAGATYYSDEYAVLDKHGLVHPYARALGMRTPNSFESKKVRAEEIGAQIGTRPLRVGLVVSTNFKDGARWRPRPLSRGKGVLELMANTVSARSQPELALTVLPKALEAAQILKGVRGEAREIVDSILGRVA